MTDAKDDIQRYKQARVDGAKTAGDSYRHYLNNPEAFVAGVQYALDRVLSQSKRYYNLPYPADGVGDVVTVHMLHVMGVDILEKAKRGEPQ
jgi:hypothetical protein